MNYLKMNNLNSIGFKEKIIAFSLIFSILPALLIGTYAYHQAEHEMNYEIQDSLEKQAQIEKSYVEYIFWNAQEKVNSDLNSARILLAARGSASVQDGMLIFGDSGIVNGNNEFVDEISSVLGDSVTIFQVQDGTAVRIATTNLNDDGSRATGTAVSQEVYNTVVRNGDTYYGRAWVVNQWHRSAYTPIKDSSGNIIGILGLGMSEEPFWQDITTQMAGLDIGENGYFYVMDSEGNLLIHPDSQGENVYDYSFIQTIIADKEGYVEYSWEGQDKVSAYTYYEPADLYIVSTAYRSDFSGPIVAIRNGLIAGIFICILFGSAIGIFFSRSITRPLDSIITATDRIAEGDLSVQISNDSSDELGKLSGSINKMVANLGKLVGEIKSSSSSVSSAAEEMAATSEQVSASSGEASHSMSKIVEGAQQQYLRSDEIARAMSDMTVSIQSISENAQLASVTATDASNLIKEVGVLSQSLGTHMSEIQDAVEVSASDIGNMDLKSQQIGEIVELITNIADQTNLLALNAAIEAARAGESGKGFAVVADEVRKLAESSGNAAQQIAKLIVEMQAGAKKAVHSMETEVVKVSEGSRIINETVEAVQKIVGGGGKVAAMAQEIASSARDQSASIEEITASIEEISAISQSSVKEIETTSETLDQGVSSMKELESSAEKLAILADSLQNEISMFRLGSETARK